MNESMFNFPGHKKREESKSTEKEGRMKIDTKKKKNQKNRHQKNAENAKRWDAQ